MEVHFYSYDGIKNKITKSLNTAFITSGEFVNELNLLSPMIKTTIDVITENYNYIYIPILKRYYYIDDITIERTNFYILKCSIDVLMSFADDIKNSRARIINSENPNPNLINCSLSDNLEITEFNFTDNFNHSGDLILITTIGGNR